ncbi:hypothetical protein JL720_11959 [Aureococcus anophagefferens]|nr:hypothetical protein JL720_11959 [Aureococcus anophagefferens]
MFHERHPDVGLLLNVTRHPYSFNGDSRRGSLAGHGTKEGNEPTWHDSLLGYCGGDAARRAAAEDGMRMLGRRAGIELDYGVQTNWQPIDSQRSMLWARRFGLAEEFMDHLGHRHFEQRKSASHRATLLDAGRGRPRHVRARRVPRLRRARRRRINAIPYFVFGPVGMRSPFRSGPRAATTVNGSGNPDEFLRVFEDLLARELPADIGALSVKQLRSACKDRGINTVGCSEKGDLVALLAASR